MLARAMQSTGRMKNTQELQRALPILASAAMLLSLPGCRIVGDIFKAGMGVGIVAVVFVLAIAGGLVALLSRGR
jgi:hypothetical protein